MRGVGLSAANKEIQIDRYSKISDNASIAHLDTTNYFAGWKTKFSAPNAWVQYNKVDFGSKVKSIEVKASSANGGTHSGSLLIKVDGPVVAEVSIPKGSTMKSVEAKVSKSQKGRSRSFCCAERLTG